MNTNFFQSLMTLALTVLSVLMGFDWTIFGASPQVVALLVGAIGFGKLALSAVKDGMGGLISPKVVVKS